MNTQALARQFEAIGAQLDIRVWTPAPEPRTARAMTEEYTLDVAGRKGREVFSLVVRPDAVAALDLLAVDVQPKQRHLLLLAKPLAEEGEKKKFLCGHDERHWFVAGVPRAASVATVAGAMEALKPVAARISQLREGVRGKDWHKRHNAGFLRQGEWFFLPMPDFAPPDPRLILDDEPIRRTGGKPHIVEHLFRFGGTRVYVHRKYPSGLMEREYRALIARNPKAAAWPWSVMQRNPAVYAKGKIRHSDHATLVLPFWHRVLMSDEQTAANVVFLD